MTTRSQASHATFVPPALALLLTALLATCSAEFKSGMTKCSVSRTCPDGFTCSSNGYCISPGGNVGPGGTGGSPGSDAGRPDTTTGTGGTTTPAGTGGTTTPAGTGGSSGPPDAGPPANCTDPKFPVSCPALGNVSASCAPAGSDCSTLGKCGNDPDPFICKTGEVLDCQYAATNPCSPKNNTCPTGRSPTATQFCAGKGGAGPVCASTSADCATLQACPNGDLVLCTKGNVGDCKYKYNQCSPAGGTCSNPMYPKFCPALGDIGPGCYGANIECASVAVCEDEIVGCTAPGLRVDCAMMKCVPAG
jgi:hypothetical protein